METLEQIKLRIESALPLTKIDILANECAAGERSFVVVDDTRAFEVAKFLRDDAQLKLDYCSNVTGIDWPETKIKTKVKKKVVAEGVEKEVEEIVDTLRSGHLEAVYHLYSMELKHGPVVLRMRTENRTDKTHLPSLTPLWRGAEFQEREVYDLYGVIFDGHPDLRRILMWDEFVGFPMRRDYVAPDDFEYEPTPHDEVLEAAKKHFPAEPKAEVKA
ncbi:MAG TPA: NADH-quinone oxidoreductase subunit C [Verrucomicrobiae bacterium]